MRDSAEILTDQPPRAADARIAFGPEPLQFGDLRVPPGHGPFPLALVLHGGYWQAIYNLIHLGHLCEALRDAGIASWNLEYRCVGDPDGEWPAAAQDLTLALGQVNRLPLRRDGRVVLVGHSAGGQLALWAAKQARLPVLALAPVSDVRDAVARRGLESAPGRYMAPEHFEDGSPVELLPLGVPQILVHGTRDESVPYEMSERYVAAAAGEAELVTLADSGHFEPIDPLAVEWPMVMAALERLLGARGSAAPPR
jgi:pimeloyl-ACP methyl ester carboxylesterase